MARDHGVRPQVELAPVSQINAMLERVRAGKARCRDARESCRTLDSMAFQQYGFSTALRWPKKHVSDAARVLRAWGKGGKQ
eukprot:scaffold114039_cov63-Phaeocystis_antarctica.AAC.1